MLPVKLATGVSSFLGVAKMVEEMAVLRNESKIIGSSPFFTQKSIA